MTLIDKIADPSRTVEAVCAVEKRATDKGNVPIDGASSPSPSPSSARDAQAAVNAEMQALAKAVEPMLSEIKGSLKQEPVAALLAVFGLGLTLGIALTR